MILIVDDDRRIVETLTTVLHGAGYTVRTAGDGAEAVGHLRVPECECLLLDLNMPHVDGLELLGIMQKQDLPIPTIVITGCDHVDIAAFKRFANVVALFRKPFDPDELLAALREHVLPRVRVALFTSQHRISGEMAVRRHQSPADALSAGSAFLTLTQVRVADSSGRPLLEAATLSVARRHIVMLMPEADDTAHPAPEGHRHA